VESGKQGGLGRGALGEKELPRIPASARAALAEAASGEAEAQAAATVVLEVGVDVGVQGTAEGEDHGEVAAVGVVVAGKAEEDKAACGERVKDEPVIRDSGASGA
jgi:hypothetical protein